LGDHALHRSAPCDRLTGNDAAAGPCLQADETGPAQRGTGAGCLDDTPPRQPWQQRAVALIPVLVDVSVLRQVKKAETAGSGEVKTVSSWLHSRATSKKQDSEIGLYVNVLSIIFIDKIVTTCFA
jgi:hypothetical protein